MAKMIPPSIHSGCNSYGEKEIFKRLKDDPQTKDWIVLHSLDLTNHLQQVSGEIDFLIIIPTKGVLCLEVKACSKLRRDGGNWYYGSERRPDPRGPFKQASSAMHSLREKLIERRPDLGRIIFWSGVIFPYVDFKVKSEEWHMWQVIDSKAFRSKPLSKLAEEILDNARVFLKACPNTSWFFPGSREPYQEQCEVVAEILRPSFEVFEKPRIHAERLEKEVKNFTEEQFIALDVMEANLRVVFTGPAGTGKTILALESARRKYNEGKKVLFLCFNRLLGNWLEEQTKDLQPFIKTGTLHSYMLEVAGLKSRMYQDADSDFWENGLPLLATEKLMDSQDDYVYEELIIDESQDILRENYLDFLDLSLSGGLATGKWRFFGDFEKQAIYNSVNLSLRQFIDSRTFGTTIYSLRNNCRNTPRIASAAQLLGGLNPGYSKILREDDRTEPKFIYYTSFTEQQEKLVESLQALYSEGFTGRDIIILSPKAVDSAAVKISVIPWKDRVKPYGAAGQGYIAYSSIHAFKGLEAPAVIVTDIERILGVASNSIFYTALTRALHRLVILAHKKTENDFIQIIMKGNS